MLQSVPKLLDYCSETTNVLGSMFLQTGLASVLYVVMVAPKSFTKSGSHDQLYLRPLLFTFQLLLFQRGKFNTNFSVKTTLTTKFSHDLEEIYVIRVGTITWALILMFSQSLKFLQESSADICVFGELAVRLIST